MSKGAHGIFPLVFNLLGVDSQPKHVHIGLFEANETIVQALAKNLIKLLDTWFEKKKLAYVKDDGSNLNIITIALNQL
jgi:hypothetical protein